MLYRATRHLPGIGGPQGLDELTTGDAVGLLKQLSADLEAEAAAIRAGKR